MDDAQLARLLLAAEADHPAALRALRDLAAQYRAMRDRLNAVQDARARDYHWRRTHARPGPRPERRTA